MRASHRRTRGGRRRRRTSPWRTAGLFLTAVLTAGGTGLLVAAVTVEPPYPPQPAADVAPPELPTEEHVAAPPAGADAVAGMGMPRSVPVRIRIPEIDVDAAFVSLGVDEGGEVEVPALDKAMDAGWYEYGPAPGETGNAVVIGHVDSRTLGPAVFFQLGRLKPGDTIEVARTDGSLARFAVDGVKSFSKEEFPAELVYGPSDRAGLRLVTCGGNYDRRTGGYLGNVIVFATLRA